MYYISINKCKKKNVFIEIICLQYYVLQIKVVYL